MASTVLYASQLIILTAGWEVSPVVSPVLGSGQLRRVK